VAAARLNGFLTGPADTFRRRRVEEPQWTSSGWRSPSLSSPHASSSWLASPTACEELAMNELYVVGAIVAAALFVYLGVALLKPERFE
jgi:K+-transporting ATPase KdpF subunit